MTITLSPLQMAYWSGRQSTGIAAHFYTEWHLDTLDLSALKRSVQHLYLCYPCLRLSVSADGEAKVMPFSPDAFHQLHILDGQHWSDNEVASHLHTIRTQKMHQTLALEKGQSVEFAVTLLPNGRAQLHLDVEMLAVDGSSVCRLMSQWAQWYLCPPTQPLQEDTLLPALSDLHAQRQSTSEYRLAQQWWQQQLAQIAPAPLLPLPSNDKSTKVGETERWSTTLSLDCLQALEHQAARSQVTMSTLCLTLFQLVLSHQCQQSHLRLMMPSFYRPWSMGSEQQAVGDFSDVSVFSAHSQKALTLGEHLQINSKHVADLLSHRAYSGVEVMRDLSRTSGKVQEAPVVFTSGWQDQKTLFSPQVVEVFGDLQWASSQGAHVLLDAQFAPCQQGLLINWDVRMDKVDRPWVDASFHAMTSLLSHLTRGPQYWQQPWQKVSQALLPDIGKRNTVEDKTAMIETKQPAAIESRSALSPLQQTYLFGREESTALGGVAMHDCRLYQGHWDVRRWQKNLTLAIEQCPMLRKRIDVNTMTQMVVDPEELPSDLLATNSQCIDLRTWSRQAALDQVAADYQQYRQTRHDLNRFPWFMSLWLLPKDPADSQAFEQVVMSSFDALLVDGHGISAFMQQFFAEQPRFPDAQVSQSLSVDNIEAEQTEQAQRQVAKAYWQQQKISKDATPQLPWLQPLDSIYQAQFARRERVLEHSCYRSLCRESAKSRCFINSTLSWAASLSLLAWQCGDSIRVGLPIAFPHPGQVWDNQSSFIALETQRRSKGTVAEQVKLLQTKVAQGFEHRAYSGIDLARDIVSQTGDAFPLPVVITNGLAWPKVEERDGMQLQKSATQTPQIALDIRFTLTEQGDLVIAADYVTQALSTGWVDSYLDHCQALLERLAQADSPFWQRPLSELTMTPSIAPPCQQKANTYDFLGRIAERMQTQSDEVLCYYQDKAYTARWFYQHVSALMNYWQNASLSRGEVVAIALPKGPEHLAVLVSCALSGLIWVPIDTHSPETRRRYLLSHCQAKLIVGKAQLTGFDIHRFDHLITQGQQQPDVPWPSADTLASLSLQVQPSYYLYTSGTTGQPKCVVLNNRATANVLGQTLAQWRVSEQDRLLSVTPWHHDMSLFDTLGMLSCGGQIVVPSPEQEKDALAWYELAKRYDISLWCSVPAILEMLLACANLDSMPRLRLIAQGGDYIKPDSIDTLRAQLPKAELYSLGGPTETTVWSIWHHIQPSDGRVIAYGKALAGNAYYILNDQLQPCLPYQVGRMYCAGVNLANGYLQQDELVQHDFVELPLADGHTLRAYQTSDQGYIDAQGKIMFTGRLNGYIKVRGVRISLPDVEKSLLETNQFVDLVALPFEREDGDIDIGAAYIRRDHSLSESQARHSARQVLPVSHLPSVWLACEYFPLSANGKVDRRALTHLIEDKTRHTSFRRREEQVMKGAQAIDKESALAQQLIALYEQVANGQVGQSHSAVVTTSNKPIRQHSSLTHTGVQANHLIDIQRLIRQRFGKAVSLAQLIACRHGHDLAKLIT